MGSSSIPPPEPAPHILRLVPYQPGKPIAEVKRELGLPDVIKLASNENALGPSRLALEAIAGAASDLHLYPEGSCHDLRQALARHLQIPEGCLVFGNGSDELIHLLGLAFLEPGDEVVQAHPTFVRYEAAAILNQAVSIRVPLKRWEYDAEALMSAICSRTRLVFLANPNNPTGTYLGKSALEALLAVLPERCILCSDEAYYEFADAEDYPQTLEYVLAHRNVVVLRTFSKIYGLAGLRMGYGIARPEIIRVLEQVREPFNVNSLAQVAATAALGDVEHVARSRELAIAGRVWLSGELRKLGFMVYPSQANFVWVDTRQDAMRLFQQLLRRGIIVRTGDIFGAPTCLRITVGTAQQNERLIAALQEVLAP